MAPIEQPLTLEELTLKVAPFCRRHGIARMEVFGSFARSEAKPSSDVDFLVTFQPGSAPGWDFLSLPEELEEILGRKVDLFTRDSVEADENWIRRRSILDSALEIYAA